MEMVDAIKQIGGVDIDYLKAVAKEAGFTAVFKNTAWDGIFAGLSRPLRRHHSVTITDERKKQYDFSDPYINVGQIWWFRRRTRSDLAGLKGRRWAPRSAPRGHEIKGGWRGAEDLRRDRLAFEDMVAGGSPAWSATSRPRHYALQRQQYKAKFRSWASLHPESYGFVVKKGTRSWSPLNKGIKAVKAKGIDEQLRRVNR
jgi:polar amino acid transport system substrate-binding protein